MHPEKIEGRLFEIFRKATSSRLSLDEVQSAFSRACPELNDSAERRARLVEAVERLSAQGLVTLPANRKKDWQNFLSPPLPHWIRVVREKSPKNAASFDHAAFPWVKEMRFLASLPTLPAITEARQLHEFFKSGGTQRPIVPIKERSWQIFGYEKRLEELVSGKFFFGPDRLKLEMLRCRPVSYSLIYQLAPKDSSEAPIILENEATFHSFARLNSVASKYSAVIFGNGQAVLKGGEFLKNLSHSLEQKRFLYFGDIDSSGLRIPCDLSKQLHLAGIEVVPVEAFYQDLLATAEPDFPAPENVAQTYLDWLPSDLSARAKVRLARSGRIAQEALGWERLCTLYSINPETDFYAGF